MKRQLIQVFEHQKLKIGKAYKKVEFTQNHFDALVRYNEQYDNRYFTPIYKGIKFSQYVGVIQVGKLTIEILPKADNLKNNHAKWHKGLIGMLKVCRYLKLEGSTEANLKLQNANLLDLYIYTFLKEVELLLHQGLIKKYRLVQENSSALSGSLQFQKHISKNLVHKERFYIQHQTYDKVHLLHQILQAALSIIPTISSNNDLQDKIGRILLAFPKLPKRKINAPLFETIHLDRKTLHYQKALDLAKLLLLNFNPDLKSGQTNVLAILFDMNRLFEEYLFRILKKKKGIVVKAQRSKYFWENKKIRPDIVLIKDGQTFVLDAKWKMLQTAKPSDADLKQMYVYHQYWDALTTLLVYPKTNNLETISGKFRSPIQGTAENKQTKLSCKLLFVELVDKHGHLRKEVAKEVVESCKGLDFVAS